MLKGLATAGSALLLSATLAACTATPIPLPFVEADLWSMHNLDGPVDGPGEVSFHGELGQFPIDGIDDGPKIEGGLADGPVDGGLVDGPADGPADNGLVEGGGG